MPIVEIPGVGRVEFPDSMDGPAISAAAKKLHFDAKAQKQQEEDRARYNPAGDSFLGNLLPSAGAGMASILRAVGAQPLLNRMGLENLPQSKEEAAQLDAPLNTAPGGTTGRVLGSAALLAPTAFIPGANTALGATLIGGGTGLLTTEGDLGDRAEGALYGAGGGLLGNLGGRAIGAGYRAAKGVAKGLARPFTERGRDIIAGEAIERFATNPAAIQAARGGASITGAVPTLAEAANDPGIAALQRAISTMDPDAAAQFLARDQANNAARVGLLSDMAGTTGARTAASSARETAAQTLYGNAFAQDVSKNMTPAIQSEITSLLKRPSIQAARAKAAELAADKGMDTLEEGSVQGLHFMKLAMDDMINGAGQRGIGGVEKGALIANRDKLVSVIEKLAPDYAAAKTTYAAMSKPLNQMDAAQRLLDSTRAASADLAGNRPFQAASFARAINNEESLLKNATGRQSLGTLADVLDPDQLAKVNAIRSELDTVAGLDKAAGGKGSQTAKMLASQQLLRNIGGPLGMPDSWVESGLSQTLLRPAQFAASAVEPRIHAAVARGLLDPTEAQRLIQIARSANTATPSELARLAQALSPGLLGYGAAQASQ